jgi:hypothetical protein
MTRRTFLRSAAQAAALGAFAGAGLLGSGPGGPRRAAAAQASSPPLVWVWKFSADGQLGEIRDKLQAHGLGVIFKTHDGTNWMERYDRSPDAITGPAQVARLASHFEQAGIPFHAWCVVQGEDPVREAAMCAEALDAGARGIFLDLEPSDGSNYWQGRPHDAYVFGEELRRLKPDAWVTLAPDVRPWQAPAVPLAEFMSFSNAVAPQSYWETFDGPTNHRYLRQHGYQVTPEGFTPELVVDVALGTFQQFGRPIQPIGQGAASADDWRRFVSAAESRGMQPLSLWRYGSADPGAFEVLLEAVRRQTAALEAAAAAAAEAEIEAPAPPPIAEPVSFGQSLSDVPQIQGGYQAASVEDSFIPRPFQKPESRLQRRVRQFLGQ